MTFLSAMIAFYAYDKTSGSSLKRAALAALAGSAVSLAEALIVAGIGAVAYNQLTPSSLPAGTMTGLAPDHYPGVLPAHGGIPKNVYTRMPSVPNIGMAFGQL